MKRFLAPLIAFLSYLMLAPSVFATHIVGHIPTSVPSSGGLISCDNIQAPFKDLCDISTGDVGSIIGAAISFIFVIGVIIAIFFLLLGAVKWIYSGGDKAAIESARGTITSAIVGLVLLFLVFLIFTVLLNFFGFGIENIENIPAITPGA